MAVKYGSLPFDAQIAFFRKKLAMPSRSWTDIMHGEHDHAFVVAGATRMDLVTDMQGAVQKAIENGTTLHEFRKDFDRIVAERGWTGWTGEGTKAGRAWRTKVIYQTNLRTSYAAGRFEQLQKLEYWQYHHSPASEDPRKQHVDWDGLILPKDDPFWLTHYPPNDFGCKCWVTGLSKQRMAAKGLTPSQSPKIEMEQKTIGTRGPNPRTVSVPKGIGPGFAYAPGRSAWMHAHVPAEKMDAPSPFNKRDAHFRIIPDRASHDLMPDPRPFPAKKLLPPMPAGKEEAYASAFLQAFKADIGKPVVFTDVAGESMVISDDLFKDHTGAWKMRRDRDRYLLLLADTVRDPDEIWAFMEYHRATKRTVARRVYLSRHTINGERQAAWSVFEYDKDGWNGVSSYQSDQKQFDEWDNKITLNRRGIRLYKRGEK
ncbi:PBECR2 nuclease fold domain-containing protein [Mariprofundus ferrooxydans]|uniref:Bacteriophage Mu GP30-like protein n=1 Tax=Mariprofundus ferrooxydans PV-1 TaxID=314345 RepID=Q0EWD5_9PROT|nr:PBECR2 nuclease fold domain-containing protein [Mariprofundus ferrooxydans]EAU53536.1 bacteriophage Mu GP30-like protein [Mariprofundus ferrooxydans PV-1]KON47014.1 hypothetical protein AL013_10510 [Mariprofundus ferrooxydans]